MNAADRLALLEVHCGIRIALTPDGQHLDVDGPSLAVDAAEPMLRQYRDALLTHLLASAVRPAHIPTPLAAVAPTHPPRRTPLASQYHPLTVGSKPVHVNVGCPPHELRSPSN